MRAACTVTFICQFPSSKECPNTVSTQFGNHSISNAVKVERQIEPNKSIESKGKSDIILCLPALTGDFDGFKPHRLTEYFEYQKLAGVKLIVMGELNATQYNFTIADSSMKVLQYYKDIAFLKTYGVSIPEFSTSELHHIVARSKPNHYTYCMIKYARVSDYIIVQDLDEVVGFNTNFYQNLPEVISAATDKKFAYSSFALYDQPVARRCNYTNILKNASDFTLMRAELFFRKNIHRGKTIHSSQTCQLAEWHDCAMRRSDPKLKPKKSATFSVFDEKFSKLVDLRSEKGKNLMISLHNRDEMHRVQLPNQETNVVCAENKTVKLNWVNKLSPELLSRSMVVLKKLKLQSSNLKT